MRLIDGDALLDEFISLTPYGMGLVGIKYVDDLIKSQPTAYDVDKVVANIEEFADCEDCRKRGIDKKFYYGQGCKACAFGKIIDIVKRGGVQ